MIFSTIDGAVQIDPSAVPQVPLPRFNLYRVHQTPAAKYPNRGTIHLPVGQRSVGFSYTAPYLMPMGGLRFRYRLDGIETEWIQAGERREAFYGQLPPGKYTFPRPRAKCRRCVG